MICASKWIARGRSYICSASSMTTADSPAWPARLAAMAPTGPQPTIIRSQSTGITPTGRGTAAAVDVEVAVERIVGPEVPEQELGLVKPD